MKKEKINAFVGIFILIVSFIAISYALQKNTSYFEEVINKTRIRDFAIIFVLLLIIATVFAPVSLLPVIPLASYAYGWVITGILIIIGQFVGALIAFGLSRKYGRPLVTKVMSLEEIEKYGKMLPEGNLFWMIVFLRIAFPIDVLSYVFGLFSQIKFQTYAFATLLGIIPGAFALSYVGSLELRYQLIAFVMALIVILIGFGLDARYRKKFVLKDIT